MLYNDDNHMKKTNKHVLTQIQKLALNIFSLEINLEMIIKAVLDFM